MQLDLFDPRPAKIFVFPPARRHALVARTARAIDTQSGKRRESTWQRVLDRLRADLALAGIGEAEVMLHLKAFRDEVARAILHQREHDHVA